MPCRGQPVLFRYKYNNPTGNKKPKHQMPGSLIDFTPAHRDNYCGQPHITERSPIDSGYISLKTTNLSHALNLKNKPKITLLLHCPCRFICSINNPDNAVLLTIGKTDLIHRVRGTLLNELYLQKLNFHLSPKNA